MDHGFSPCCSQVGPVCSLAVWLIPAGSKGSCIEVWGEREALGSVTPSRHVCWGLDSKSGAWDLHFSSASGTQLSAHRGRLKSRVTFCIPGVLNQSRGQAILGQVEGEPRECLFMEGNQAWAWPSLVTYLVWASASSTPQGIFGVAILGDLVCLGVSIWKSGQVVD